MSYCHSAPSGVRPSVRRKLSHFQLLLWNRWTEFKETWQEARSQRPLPSLCFSGRSEKQDGRPGLWLAEALSTSPLKPLNGIKGNSTGSKISTPSTKFVFFGRIGKTRWPPWPLIGWDIFDFSSETAEGYSTKIWQEARSQRPIQSLCFSGWSENQDGRPGLWLAETFSTSSLKLLNGIQQNFVQKQDLNALYQVCVFQGDRKNKMAALASDWLRHFRPLLYNRCTEFNETCQEARYQCLLPSLCISGRSEKQDGRPGLWLAETFSTSSPKPLNGIQRNLSGSKISTASTKFVFIGAIGKIRWPPWPLIGWDIFDFYYRTARWMFTKLGRDRVLIAPQMH